MSAALEYCVLRIVPDIERAEFINTGVLLICRATRLLDCRLELDADRVMALWPKLDPETLPLWEAQLATLTLICRGDLAGGPMALLDWRERWHWLTSPASTVIQPGPVHTAITDSPSEEVDRLFTRYVTV